MSHGETATYRCVGWSAILCSAVLKPQVSKMQDITVQVSIPRAENL